MHQPKQWLVLCTMCVAVVMAVLPTSAISAEPRVLQAVLFYEDAPQNDGYPGYVVIAKFSRARPKNYDFIGALGEAFSMGFAFDRARHCYSGGVPKTASTRRVKVGRRYRVEFYVGPESSTTPDSGSPTQVLRLTLRTRSAARQRVLGDFGCRDTDGLLPAR